MTLHEIVSAVYNDIQGGLSGYTANINISLEQLEDEIIEERLSVIKEFYMQGVLGLQDHMSAINCIEVDCKDTAKCCNINFGEKNMHFEIPQIITDLKEDALAYVGSADRKLPYKIYTNTTYTYHKYHRRKFMAPFVYIETTPNENNKYDCWLFNMPFAKNLAVIGIFKDPRQLEEFSCCNTSEYLSFNALGSVLKDRITKKKLMYYRQYIKAPMPNTQNPG